MGLLDSRENENMQIARQLLSIGIDIDQICEITKLSKEQVNKLLETS